MSIEKEIKKIVAGEVSLATTQSEMRHNELMAELQAIRAMLETPVTSNVTVNETPGEVEQVLKVEIIETEPEAPALTYDDLLQNGWTDEQIRGSEYVHLAPEKPAVTDEERNAILAEAVAQLPHNEKGSYTENLLNRIAKHLGKGSIEAVTNEEVAEHSVTIQASVNETTEFIQKANSEKVTVPPPVESTGATPPPPPGKSVETATVVESPATVSTPAPPAGDVESTEKALLNEAAAGAPVPPAPVFTPGGVQ